MTILMTIGEFLIDMIQWAVIWLIAKELWKDRNS